VVAFGNKDLQQLRVIEQMIRDFNMPLYLEAVPTCREASGLALSSRNRYLTPEAKVQASRLNIGLHDTLQLVLNGMSPDEAEATTTAVLERLGWAMDYIAVRDAVTFQAVTSETTELAVLGAARLNGVRLIDNITHLRA
jgi:pantoate--beta-alanine ligase